MVDPRADVVAPSTLAAFDDVDAFLADLDAMTFPVSTGVDDCSGESYATPEQVSAAVDFLSAPMSSRAMAREHALSPSTVARMRALLDVRVAVTGLDGKTYPPSLTEDERDYLVVLVHRLRHEKGLGYRGIVAELKADGLPGSVGTVQRYLTRWDCPDCSGAASDAPEQGTIVPAVTR